MSHPIRTEHVQSAALATAVSEHDLNDLLTEIQTTAEANTAKFFENSLIHDDEGAEVLNFKAHEEVILAVHPAIWRDTFGDLDLSDEETRAVQEAYYDHSLDLAKNGHNNLQPTAVDEFHGKLLVFQLPSGWGTARLATAWQFKEFARDGLSAAEMLDYWVVENQGMPLKGWASDRDVGVEAVRKNIRQAKSKFQHRD